MSNRYKGGVISATPPTTTGGEDGTASGAWTLEQQMQLQAAGLWPSQPPPPYIENVFQTWLYTGTGAAQTITNGINLSGKGGLIWTKYRTAAYWHTWFDTVRGNTKVLYSNSTSGEDTLTNTITSFNSTGYTLGVDSNGGNNTSGGSFVSWTFREQPKFFDIVTYTGDGTSPRAISHNLGSAPGCVIIKQTNAVNDWCVWHTATGNDKSAALNLTDAFATFAQRIKSVTSTTFSVGNSSTVNDSGATYVAYLFAHDAGGFGLTETDNVISCGSFTTDGSSSFTPVNLGYEPQWLMIKASSQTSNWVIVDNMRGLPVGADDARLLPNTSDAEATTFNQADISATGFGPPSGGSNPYGASQTYIYIAIRRGPMKVPTSGTSVYAAVARTGTSTTATITAGFAYDWLIAGIRNLAYGSKNWDRLRGITNPLLNTVSTAAEYTGSANSITAGTQDGLTVGADSDWTINYNLANYINWFFKRAPSVFDIVCYTGTGSATTQTHNLGVVPELVIWKRRSSTSNWRVWQASFSVNDGVYLDSTFAKDTDPNVQTAIPTATVLNLATGAYTNASGSTYVAYLFATCPGVSKVGSYTGTGALQTVNCGFTTGARFVLIKRTDSTGDWYVYDTTRGMTSGDDPYYLLNSNNAEVTNTNYVDTDSTGFKVTAAAPAAINANGGTFIFLAIA
jgi:hypothetical protein